MKSIDSYLCKEREKVLAFNFYGKDYFVGQKLTPNEAELLSRLAQGVAPMDFRKAIKICRFADARYVDCTL